MNNIEEYQNLIELLKKALQFYADASNYIKLENKPSNIELDEYGSQARFAISKIDEMFANNQKILNEYNEIVSELSDDIDIDEFFKKLNDINNYNELI